jgi:hypothetical protein
MSGGVHNPDKLKALETELETEAEQLVGKAVSLVEYEVRRWPALVALVVIGGAFFILSERLQIIPVWVLLPILFILISAAITTRLRGWHRLNHWLLITTGLVITAAEVGSIILLLASLPDKNIAAISLLTDAGILWITNVLVFSLWYWQLDGGGPYARNCVSGKDYHQHSELLFVQLILKGDRPTLEAWRPRFTDYLFLAFNTSTAFSPTDTAVLSTRIKALNMLQASLSLITLAALAARAINIL